MVISYSVVEDERFPGRSILIGETASGAKYYASFAGRREKAELAIRDAARLEVKS